MCTSLTKRVAEVQRAARRLVQLHGLARWFFVALATAMLLGLVDYLLRPADAAPRWLLSLSVTGIWLVAFLKLALQPFVQREDLVAVAVRIEQHFSQLLSQLSSAIAFLEQLEGSSAAGSTALRSAVVAQAEALSAPLDFHSVLQFHEVQKSVRWALLGAGAAALLGALAPGAVSLAAMRLAMPWRDLPWPRRHELVIVERVERLA